MKGQPAWVKIQLPTWFWGDLKKFLNLSEPQFPLCIVRAIKHTSQERPKDQRSYLRNPDVVSVIIQTAH